MSLYYEDDLIKLYHGDCRELLAWLECDVLVTEPPYGINWPSGSMHTSGKEMRVANSIKGDDSTELRDVVLQLWNQKGAAIVFGSWRQPRPIDVSHRLIWYKKNAFPGFRTSAYYPAEEEIYLIGNGWSGKPMQNVITTHEMRHGAAGLAATTGHPTPKPLGLMETLIDKCPAGSIADPFAGSGATLIAARNSGRKAIGVELEEEYCELIARRLAQDVLL